MRKPLVVGNWKMNGSKALVASLCQDIALGSKEKLGVDIVICPPFTLLGQAADVTEESGVRLGAQDLDPNPHGAFTGQISAGMIKDCGAEFVILGHSERRTLYNESDDLITDKVLSAISHSLTPILCVGETATQRDAGETESIVQRQIQNVINATGISVFDNIVIAYEPVWAIGTGLTATPDQAQTVHGQIRQLLAQEDENIAQRCRILYGGSMNPTNAKELIAKTDIDGGLIGGASLKADAFLSICQSALEA